MSNINTSVHSEYETYKLAWMISHGYTLNDLMKSLEDYKETVGFHSTMPNLFKSWEDFGCHPWLSFAKWIEKECAVNKILTTEDIKKAMLNNVIKLSTGIDVKATRGKRGEIICVIGDYYFYFAGEEGEDTTVEQFMKDIPFDTIAEKILEVLNDFKRKPETVTEYLYYWYYIKEHM